MTIFEEIREELKKESKQCLPELREIQKTKMQYYKHLDTISKPTLVLLLYQAIEKIDELKNSNCERDERDWADCLCDKESIFDRLVDEQVEECELYEE